MNDVYISIAEFAKRAGVSHQAIYKRLATDLQPWLHMTDGKKTINIQALELFNNENVATKSATNSTEVATIKLLQKTVELLEKELSLKNEEIKNLHDRLKESHVLLDQQQHLHAANLIEERTAADVSEPAESVQLRLEEKSRHIDQKEEKLEQIKASADYLKEELREAREELERVKSRSLWQRIRNR